MKFLKFRTSKLFLAGLVLLQVSCGTQEESTYNLASSPADLRFSGAPVEMLIAGVANPILVNNSGTFKIPCQLQGFRARYRYENVGGSPAAAHSNASAVTGSGTYAFAQGILGVGTIRSAFASFGKVNLPNIETKIAIRLDSPAPGSVSESNESNNTWVAKVIRVCP